MCSYVLLQYLTNIPITSNCFHKHVQQECTSNCLIIRFSASSFHWKRSVTNSGKGIIWNTIVQHPQLTNLQCITHPHKFHTYHVGYILYTNVGPLSDMDATSKKPLRTPNTSWNSYRESTKLMTHFQFPRIWTFVLMRGTTTATLTHHTEASTVPAIIWMNRCGEGRWFRSTDIYRRITEIVSEIFIYLENIEFWLVELIYIVNTKFVL